MLPALAAPATATAPAPVRQVNWTRFHFDARNTGFNPYETILSPDTVGSLVSKWTAHLADPPGFVNSAPAVVNGMVYVGCRS